MSKRLPHMTCSACNYWERKTEGESDGFCCNKPPVVVRNEDNAPTTCWPQSEASDWCGYWNADE